MSKNSQYSDEHLLEKLQNIEEGLSNGEFDDSLDQCFLKVSHLAPQGGICNLKGRKILKGVIAEDCE